MRSYDHTGFASLNFFFFNNILLITCVYYPWEQKCAFKVVGKDEKVVEKT